MSRYRYWLATLLLASACSALVEPPIDGPFAALHVNGTVRTTDGAPVVGAALDVRARLATTCTGDVDHGPATSTAAGAFSRMLGNWGTPRDVCVWIAVVPPAGSGLAPDTVTVTSARLDVPADTVAIDIILNELP
jgi:hypothetical protein